MANLCDIYCNLYFPQKLFNNELRTSDIYGVCSFRCVTCSHLEEALLWGGGGRRHWNMYLVIWLHNFILTFTSKSKSQDLT